MINAFDQTSCSNLHLPWCNFRRWKVLTVWCSVSQSLLHHQSLQLEESPRNSPWQASIFSQIVFYEEKCFKGRRLEVFGDCDNFQDLGFMNRVNSIRVETGAWVCFDHPDFKGQQYMLEKGEYPEFQRWNAHNDHMGSCKPIKMVSMKTLWKVTLIILIYTLSKKGPKAVTGAVPFQKSTLLYLKGVK